MTLETYLPTETEIRPVSKRERLEIFLQAATPAEPLDPRAAALDLYRDETDPDTAFRRTQDLLRMSKKLNPNKIIKTNDRNRHGYYYWDFEEEVNRDRWMVDASGKPIYKLIGASEASNDPNALIFTPHQIQILSSLSWQHSTFATELIEKHYPDASVDTAKNTLSKEIGRISQKLNEKNIDIVNIFYGGDEHEEAGYKLAKLTEERKKEIQVKKIRSEARSVELRRKKRDAELKAMGLVKLSEEKELELDKPEPVTLHQPAPIPNTLRDVVMYLSRRDPGQHEGSFLRNLNHRQLFDLISNDLRDKPIELEAAFDRESLIDYLKSLNLRINEVFDRNLVAKYHNEWDTVALLDNTVDPLLKLKAEGVKKALEFRKKGYSYIKADFNNEYNYTSEEVTPGLRLTLMFDPGKPFAYRTDIRVQTLLRVISNEDLKKLIGEVDWLRPRKFSNDELV